ncbi:hydrogen peroxide-inducible genes activator [Halodurantibacterium flavum]|uniref:LysR substrate-binding domain-containing protein n=1 Tax=Halodurantibacterium flavum TaxID=1382802 RepID=A0ABW4S7L3_9RHOB
MRVTLKQLAYFIALAEEGNFGRAAARVHVTQPALSMQIRELEQALNAPLVERRPRDIRLTRVGREVLARARRILSETEELEAAARRQGLLGRLNLGVIPTVAPYLLPPVLGALRDSGITRDLRVREAQTAQLLAALDAGQLDAVVIARPTPAPDRAILPLFTDRFLLAGSATGLRGLAQVSEHLRPVALDPEQLLLLDEGHCLADQALEVCAIDRRQTRIDLGASSLSTLCGLVAQGFGLTFLPEIALRSEEAAAPDMRVLRFAAPEPARDIALVRRAKTTDDGWFAALAELISGAAAGLLDHARRVCPPAT